MEQYVLSLVGDSSTSYKMYKGTTPLTDAELTSLFSTAGSAYFTFTFGSWTPSSTSTIQITNSSDLVVMENTGLTDAITEGKNYKGTWSANATTFDSFTELSGKALDESQLSFLMSKIKANTTALDDVAYVDDTIGTQTNEAYVGTNNIQDGAVTADKINFATFPVETITATITVGGNDSSVTLSKIKIANNTYKITGIVYGTATSVTAGSRVNVKLTLPSTLSVTACLGGAATVYQNAQVASYTQYARVVPLNGSVDAYCMCADSTNTIIWLNYDATVTVAE